tara:strand:- start:149 stop:292 length:144 start_codon:yes stop_codon:yes gene_type:complete
MAISFDFLAILDKTFVHQDSFVLDYIVKAVVVYHNTIAPFYCFFSYK